MIESESMLITIIYRFKEVAKFPGKMRGTVLVIGILLLLMNGIVAKAESKPVQRVLFISSYHPGFPTFFQQVNGIKSIFANQPILLDVEFMDSKRFSGAVNIKTFHTSLSHKLSRIEPYDLVLSADDNALSFVLSHQNNLFRAMPVVFFGVNNVDLALKQNSNPRVTGVVEALSMLETMQLIKRLHPDTRRILALVDDTPSGQADLKTFYSFQNNFPDIELSEISLKTHTFDEFASRLRQIHGHTIILLISAYRDKNGLNLTFKDSLLLIKNNLGKPIYHLWEHGMGDGIVGGKLISHYYQGAMAAKIALDVLNGLPVDRIPVRTASINQFVFDHFALKRFGIKEEDLPEDSRIINKPFSFYETYKKLVWTILLIFSALAALIIALSLNIIYRKRVEKELQNHRDHLEATVKERTAELTELNRALIDSEERFHSLSDASFEGIVITEQGRVLEMNDRFCSMFGYGPSELIGKDVDHFIAPEERKNVKNRILSGHEEVYESCCLRKDGSSFPVEIQAKTFSYRGKKVRVGAIRDISERKRAEEELQKLRGILPLCLFCKKVRDDEGYWEQVDIYIQKYSEADISHGICPECMKKHYPEM